jgi:xylulokinase
MTDDIGENNLDLCLGIDIGTTNCKVALGYSDGQIIERIDEPCHLEYPKRGWVEVDPERGWWIPLLACLKNLFDKTSVKAESIRSIGVSCTNALVCLDRDGKPVRNAIMQLDRRSVSETEKIEKSVGRDKVIDITGNRIAPGTYSLPSLLWIREEERERFDKIDTILSPAGYVITRLTGERVMDTTRAATSLLYDLQRGEWSEEIAETLGIPDHIFPTLLSPYHIAGKVTGEASRLTGLGSGTPVTAGVMDSVASAFGMGTTSPGEIGIILGTVGRVLWPLSRPTFDDRFLNIPLPEPDRWMAVACSNGTGLSIDWFADNFMGPEKPFARGEILKCLDNEASASPPGSNGILYLPFLAGERSPIWNPLAKGVFFGLDIQHTRGDLARAIMEGTSFSIRENLEILESVSGTKADTIRVSGGGSRSPIWPRILSSVLGKDIQVSRQEDSECSGALILSASGIVATPDERRGVPDDREKIGMVCATIDENKIYDRHFQQYLEIYRDLKKHFEQMHDTMSMINSREDIGL